MGPMLQVVQCWLRSATPVCCSNGRLCPFTISETGLACCLPEGWCFLGGNGKQSLLPSVPAAVLPAATGIIGSSGLCREESICNLLLCCGLELAGGWRGPVCCWAGDYGAIASTPHSPGAGRGAACCFLQPSSGPWEERGLKPLTWLLMVHSLVMQPEEAAA